MYVDEPSGEDNGAYLDRGSVASRDGARDSGSGSVSREGNSIPNNCGYKNKDDDSLCV